MIIGIVVSAIVAVFCAVIAGSVSIYGKRVDRQLAVDARHAARREYAYDLVLTAGDVAWNFIARNYVSEVDAGEPLPGEEKESGSRRCDEILVQACDLLEAHVADMNAIRPVLQDFYRTIFMNRDGSSDQYERARELVVNCRRQDTGLRKLLEERPARGWRQLIPTKSIRSWHERRRRLAGSRPLYRGFEVDQLLRSDDGVTLVSVGEDETFVAILREQEEWALAMRASVATTDARLAHWRRIGTWD
ncbi:hypothetical protein I0C86_01580 [Plantactinospora sp. S1510]|uniref:Secreted protein n=1 Tax=Plantactinospora alkalitolerans TaxID=2789879 RepID=A0ABS0GP42_9ACTN|nr:hypothetical protein [Plantactinospora alkalitolerans]MBF9127692.1 hypothetical protein [Plantactinospora alkalitolerans]